MSKTKSKWLIDNNDSDDEKSDNDVDDDIKDKNIIKDSSSIIKTTRADEILENSSSKPSYIFPNSSAVSLSKSSFSSLDNQNKNGTDKANLKTDIDKESEELEDRIIAHDVKLMYEQAFINNQQGNTIINKKQSSSGRNDENIKKREKETAKVHLSYV